ncbi:MAG: exodeoxyribonuclease VII large subunit [Thermodesulfobacteriota bacterium]
MPQEPSASTRLFTVTDLCRSIRGVLEATYPFVSVSGEISNLRRPASGHLYFVLKDDNAQLRAVMFRQQQLYCATPMRDGLQVVCRGRISVYEARGEYQLIVDSADAAGAGALQLAFERLKAKLAAAGLFAAERKRPIPTMPARAALITSPTGAALHDFLETAGRRFPALAVDLFPVRVQGEGAAAEIVRAIELANRDDRAEVIVLCRGGGSIEDLWAFNEERVAMAMAASRIPVVTGIGHETDFTIADFVADLRALTPTAAAQAITPDGAGLRRRLEVCGDSLLRAIDRRIDQEQRHLQQFRRLLRTPHATLDHLTLHLDHRVNAVLLAMQRQLEHQRHRLATAAHILESHHPRQVVALLQLRLAGARAGLFQAMGQRLDRLTVRLGHAESLLHAISPNRVLQRGYAIVRTIPGGAILRHADQAKTGDRLQLLLAKGGLEVTVDGKKTGLKQGRERGVSGPGDAGR